MKAGFYSEFHFKLAEHNEEIHILTAPLYYYSVILKLSIKIEAGFNTDLSSVPRVPLVYSIWGGRAHREGVLHDYLFRKDSYPIVSFWLANSIFLEAMKSRGKPWYIRQPMYAGVCIGGYLHYHKKGIDDVL